MRFLIGVVLLAASTIGFAQKVLKIEFATEGPREVWIHPADSPGRSSEPLAVTGASVEVPIESADPSTDAISVRHVDSGRVAMKPLKALKGDWKLVSSDYTRLYQLDVELQHEGKAVAVGLVRLEAGKEKRQEILDPSAKGNVSFFNVGPGPYRIIAEVKSEGETVATPAQTFNPKPEDGMVPKLTIAVNQVVEVVGATPATPKSGDPETDGEEKEGDEKKEVGNPMGTIVGMVLGLALLAGIGYGIYRYLQVRGAETEEQLAKLGLGGGSGAAPTSSSTPAAPQPLQQIVLTDAAPTPLGAAPIAPLAAGGISTPRLVRENGDVVLIADGPSEIGREAAIALPGECSVSRRHAVIDRQGGVLTVTDLGSTNGTWVNGRKIDAPTPIQPGDQVMFGGVKFRYEV